MSLLPQIRLSMSAFIEFICNHLRKQETRFRVNRKLDALYERLQRVFSIIMQWHLFFVRTNKIAKFEQITNSHTRVWSLFLKRRDLCWKKQSPITYWDNSQHKPYLFHWRFKKPEICFSLLWFFWKKSNPQKLKFCCPRVSLETERIRNKKKEWKTLHIYFQLLERRITSVFFHREVFP